MMLFPLDWISHRRLPGKPCEVANGTTVVAPAAFPRQQLGFISQPKIGLDVWRVCGSKDLRWGGHRGESIVCKRRSKGNCFSFFFLRPLALLGNAWIGSLNAADSNGENDSQMPRSIRFAFDSTSAWIMVLKIPFYHVLIPRCAYTSVWYSFQACTVFFYWERPYS